MKILIFFALIIAGAVVEGKPDRGLSAVKPALTVVDDVLGKVLSTGKNGVSNATDAILGGRGLDIFNLTSDLAKKIVRTATGTNKTEIVLFKIDVSKFINHTQCQSLNGTFATGIKMAFKLALQATGMDPTTAGSLAQFLVEIVSLELRCGPDGSKLVLSLKVPTAEELKKATDAVIEGLLGLGMLGIVHDGLDFLEKHIKTDPKSGGGMPGGQINNPLTGPLTGTGVPGGPDTKPQTGPMTGGRFA